MATWRLSQPPRTREWRAACGGVGQPGTAAPPARLRRTVCGLVAAPYKTLVNMAESGAALLANLFGTQSDMPRRAGRATSPAKAGTARANGAKGGNHLARIMREG